MGGLLNLGELTVTHVFEQFVGELLNTGGLTVTLVLNRMWEGC